METPVVLLHARRSHPWVGHPPAAPNLA